MNEVQPAARCGKKFDVAKPFMARLRCSNDEDPVDVWMTIMPAAKLKFIPFAFLKSAIQPLGMGTTEGKGGKLEHDQYTRSLSEASCQASANVVALLQEAGRREKKQPDRRPLALGPLWSPKWLSGTST